MEDRRHETEQKLKSKVLIIIPCYNEEANILRLYRSIVSALPQADKVMDVLFIDDCSKDETGVILRENGIPHLSLAVNLGIGGAVQAGIKYAFHQGYDWAMQMDGDGQHPPKELSKFLHWTNLHQPDLLIGSRFLEKKGFQSTKLRRIGIQFFSALIFLLSHKNITDPTSGYRMLGRRAIESAVHHYPDEYPEPEYLLECLFQGLKVDEIPIEMADRQAGTSSIHSFFQIYYMMKVSLSMIFLYLRHKFNQ